MATKIEWCDSTWNPTRGCSRVSAGCDNCYAMRQARRQDRPAGAYEGLTRIGKHGVDWSGKVRLVPEVLKLPLRWRKSRTIFVNSMSDLFHESLSNEQIAAVFGIMAAARQHTFQVLTKRAKRMRQWFEWVYHDRGFDHMQAGKLHVALCNAMLGPREWDPGDRICEALLDNANDWPLPNVWLGVSVEDQKTADERIPDLLKCPAAVKFVSAEPLLGPLNLSIYMASGYTEPPREDIINWLIVGGESGHGARPMHPDWSMKLQGQARVYGVPFFFKQWGSYRQVFLLLGETPRAGDLWVFWEGTIEPWTPQNHAVMMTRYMGERVALMRPSNKHEAGRRLGGLTYSEFPAGA